MGTISSSFHPISKIEEVGPVNDLSNWTEQYKEAFIDLNHDTSQLTLVLPDDCLLIAGPPRLSHASGEDSFYPIGFGTNISWSETRQVQPLKAIGSRRHIFSATNMPVQGSLQRMMVIGANLLRALYGKTAFGSDMANRNSKYTNGGYGSGDYALWYNNVEEDIFRVPFGLGVIFHSPATLAGSRVVAGSVYIETCTIQNCSTSIMSGQTVVMEQVSFIADRLIPWGDLSGLQRSNLPSVVNSVSSMP